METKRGVTGTEGVMTGRVAIEGGDGVGPGPDSDIDKVKRLIKLKNESEAEQWGVGFNMLAVALLEVGKALWDRPCPMEERAKLWEGVQMWVLRWLLGREPPSEDDCTWLLEETDPRKLDPEALEHLKAEIRTLSDALARLLASTARLAPAPEWRGPRMLPLVGRGLRWASYTSFTPQERGDQSRLYQGLADLIKSVSEECPAWALGDPSSLEKELAQLTHQCRQQTSEVVARIECTLGPKRPEARAHIPPAGHQPLARRTPKPGLLDPLILSKQFDDCSQSRDVDEGSRNRSGSIQQKQTELKSDCSQSRDVDEGSRNRSGSFQQKQTDWISGPLDSVTPLERSDGCLRKLVSGLWNSAFFWKWTTVAFGLIYLITFAVVIVKSIEGPSAVLLRSDNSCYRTDWMPSMNKYFWNKEETDWNTSSRLCQEKNGTLAVLHDESQVSELLKEYGRRYPWIGLYKLEEEFQWLDGTRWNSTVFPVIGYGDCVYLRKDAFSVNECTMRRSSLCRRKPCD